MKFAILALLNSMLAAPSPEAVAASLDWVNARVLIRDAAVSDAKLDLMMSEAAAKELFQKMDGTAEPHRGLVIKNSSDGTIYCQYDPISRVPDYSCELFLIRK
jgi:hypothetical protein